MRGITWRQPFSVVGRGVSSRPGRCWKTPSPAPGADVPVGSCLSGGLDSSSIVCLANRLLRQVSAGALQKTFSARSTDLRIDEGAFIDAVVGSTGVANFQVYPPLSGLFEALPLITWHQDEPFGSTSIYAQWHVFRLAAEHNVKVMLDGQGADEQLAGYHVFYTARFGSLLRTLRLGRLASEMAEVRRVHAMGAKQLLAYSASTLLPEGIKQSMRRLTGRSAVKPLEWLDMRRLGAAPSDPFLALGAKERNVRELSLSQLRYTSLPMLLHWEDRDSMAHAVESRVPFLDYRLVEFVLALPDDPQDRRCHDQERAARSHARGSPGEDPHTHRQDWFCHGGGSLGAPGKPRSVPQHASRRDRGKQRCAFVEGPRFSR